MRLIMNNINKNNIHHGELRRARELVAAKAEEMEGEVDATTGISNAEKGGVGSADNQHQIHQSNVDVLHEMDVLAVESMRTNRQWSLLPDGAAFSYSRSYIRGRDGHNWLLMKNIWRRMRYWKVMRAKVKSLKMQCGVGGIGGEEGLEEGNKGVPLIDHDINQGGRESVAIMELKALNANLKSSRPPAIILTKLKVKMRVDHTLMKRLCWALVSKNADSSIKSCHCRTFLMDPAHLIPMMKGLFDRLILNPSRLPTEHGDGIVLSADSTYGNWPTIIIHRKSSYLCQNFGQNNMEIDSIDRSTVFCYVYGTN